MIQLRARLSVKVQILDMLVMLLCLNTEPPLRLPAKFVYVSQYLVKGTVLFKLQRLEIKLICGLRIFDGIMNILLHVSLQQIIDQKTQRDESHLVLVKYFNCIDDLGRRDENINSCKILA